MAEPLLQSNPEDAFPEDAPAKDDLGHALMAVRGATTAAANSEEAMRSSVAELMQTLVRDNDIRASQVVSVFFTVTQDLNAIPPPRVAREALGWDRVPFMCFLEPDFAGMPTHCIRVLVQFYTSKSQEALRPVYQYGASCLRPDWSALNNPAINR
ncbi:MAG: chorismate mutase [Candidatus Melainabacteria bacterium]|nr:chorismate mutase [Candidatus Melainabacteria bacterium]